MVKKITVDLYELKKLIWKAMMSVNILEGVRFYVSFACSWAFAELKKMEGNAKIIKLICRDENVHLGSTQTLLKLMPKDDPDFAKISEETQRRNDTVVCRCSRPKKRLGLITCLKMVPMIGLNAQLLYGYIEWVANKRMTAVGLNSPATKAEAIPSGHKNGLQVQKYKLHPRNRNSSYVIGGTKQDVNGSTFAGMKL